MAAFIDGRRQGLSPNTILFYNATLKPFVDGYELSPDGINKFLASPYLQCCFQIMLFQVDKGFLQLVVRNGHVRLNPYRSRTAETEGKRTLPSLSTEQAKHLDQAGQRIHDKAIISLFADSGMRLSELANIKAEDIDWDNFTIS